MKLQLVTIAVLTIGIARPEAAPKAGSIKGRVVVLKGEKPGSANDVWVYLERTDGPRRATPTPAKRRITQKNRMFSPRVQVIPIGSRIAFPNDDDRDHNVFSPPPKPRDPYFDLGRYGPPNTSSHDFTDAGEFKIYCDIHPQMVATVKVVKSDWIIEVKNGVYDAGGIPAGKYKVHAWRPDSTESIEQVVIREGETIEVPEMYLQEQPATPHNHRDGRPYGPYDDKL